MFFDHPLVGHYINKMWLGKVGHDWVPCAELLWTSKVVVHHPGVLGWWWLGLRSPPHLCSAASHAWHLAQHGMCTSPCAPRVPLLQEYVLETCRDGMMSLSMADPSLGFSLLVQTGFAPPSLRSLQKVLSRISE